MLPVWLLVLLSMAFAPGCEDDEPPREPPKMGALSGDLADAALDSDAEPTADAAAKPDGGGAAKLIVELRATKLRLVPRDKPARGLVLTRDRLGILTDAELVVHDTNDWGEPKHLPVEGPRQLIVLLDGSLLAVGAKALYRLAPRAPSPTRHARIAVFAGSELFADRLVPTVIEAVHDFGDTLYQYDLAEAGGTFLTLRRTVPLTDYDGRAFLALKDGSFLYTAGQQLRRFFVGGKTTNYPAPDPGRTVWRLLAASRIDQAWIAYSDGLLALCQLGPRLQIVRTIALRDMPFDLASSARGVAIIRVEQPPGQPRSWWLEVLDQKGKSLLNQELPADSPTSGDDWVARVTRNKEVALAPDSPLVAVGGPTWLRVWNVETGQVVAPPLGSAR